ncbi:MAG: UbiA family prenyltransferase [Gammaproteobacteria bacterium]|nr:MAG: UbiA family prenyltransferase [Gammaproteobacteria bacterium]
MSTIHTDTGSSTQTKPILFVDLDGTLITTDSLWEAILQLATVSPSSLWRLPVWLFRGRARLKREVFSRVELDVSTLPYNRDLISYIKLNRERYSMIVLATATHEIFASRVADHVGIFSKVIATTDAENLKGETKLNAIEAYAGSCPIAYVGNSVADIPIWSKCDESIAVNLSFATRQRVNSIEFSAVLDSKQGSLVSIIKALRPYQWVKNVLIFVPLILAHEIADTTKLAATVTAFVAFSLIASMGYIINDLLDIEADRRHVLKKARPFASGTLQASTGLLLIGLLIVAGIVVAWNLPEQFLYILGLYFLFTNLYSFRLKRLIMLDVATLAVLYTLRIIGGAEVADVELSFWLLSFSMFFFLSLALIKRYSELIHLESEGAEATGRGYAGSDQFIIAQLGTSSALIAVLVLALYITSDNVVVLYDHPKYIWLICPLVLYWVGRLWILGSRGEINEDPLLFAMRDRRTVAVAVLAAIVLLAAL